MLWLKFSRRYMFSPKSHSVINIIAMVSMVAVAIPTAAMIILLAMFGGLSRTIETIYSAVDADIEIIANRGQTFSSNAIDIELIRATEGVVAAAPYLEQSVMVATSSRRCTVRLRGVDSTYMEVLPISDFVIRGSVDALSQGNILLGTAASGSLGIPNVNYPVELYALNRKQLSTLLPTGGISRHSCQLGGVVSANAEIDATFAMVDIDIAEKLLNYEDKLSGVAIKVEDREQIEGIKRVLQEIVGEHLTVRTREEKSVEMNSLIRLEKFAIILIGTFIAIIAAFAIVGAVVMLITDKRRDISTLRSVGASRGLIHKIFVGEGALLTLVGAAIGTTIGVGFSLGQEHFGWIKIPGNMVFESYPIELTVADTLLVLGIVIVAGLSISHLTVRARLRNEDKI
ncbi:MAG: FtsX-like permease family protein [Alistipes sp.]|nr:FtsX-like permease family protein [Alistipes sp.]